MAFWVIDRLPDDSMTITRSPGCTNVRIFEKRAIWSTPALVRESDAKIIPGVERHRDTIGHGDQGVGKRSNSTESALPRQYAGTRKWRLIPSPSAEIRSRKSIRYSCRPCSMIVVGAAVVQPRVQLARRALDLAARVVAQHLERLVDEVHAGMQRARHVVAQDQELGDPARRDHVAVDLAVGLEARHRAQQRAPLVVVDRAADVGRARQQGVILDVEDARRVVGALEVRAEADEVIGLVAQHRAEGHAAEQVRAHLHPVEELGDPARLERAVVARRASRATTSSGPRTSRR